MRLIYLAISFVFLFGCQSGKKEENLSVANPKVIMRTSKGNIELELFADKAPLTVENFLTYVDQKHYDNTVFHRVIDGFMIQGGGLTSDLKEKGTKNPIRNEADNRISNKRGTIAMARTSEVHSATSQFFINVADNDFLDYRNPTPSGFGYCVFGKVTSGMDVVDKIKNAKTGSQKGHQDVPVESITILEVARQS